jgi:hypothetical protein
MSRLEKYSSGRGASSSWTSDLLPRGQNPGKDNRKGLEGGGIDCTPDTVYSTITV